MTAKTKHKKHIVPDGDWSLEYDTDEICDGELYYDEVQEWNICTKCDYYDGVK